MLGNIASRLGCVLLPIAGGGHKNSAAWKKDRSKEVSFHRERIDFCSVLRALFYRGVCISW